MLGNKNPAMFAIKYPVSPHSSTTKHKILSAMVTIVVITPETATSATISSPRAKPDTIPERVLAT